MPESPLTDQQAAEQTASALRRLVLRLPADSDVGRTLRVSAARYALVAAQPQRRHRRRRSGAAVPGGQPTLRSV